MGIENTAKNSRYTIQRKNKIDNKATKNMYVCNVCMTMYSAKIMIGETIMFHICSILKIEMFDNEWYAER